MRLETYHTRFILVSAFGFLLTLSTQQPHLCPKTTTRREIYTNLLRKWRIKKDSVELYMQLAHTGISEGIPLELPCTRHDGKSIDWVVRNLYANQEMSCNASMLGLSDSAKSLCVKRRATCAGISININERQSRKGTGISVMIGQQTASYLTLQNVSHPS